ncbi:MAG: C40 family peptidase [Bacilli bacterium]|nr:C40 family peptidase [Bacilli bacterium]
MQILSCSGTLGTCCSDGGLVVLLDITRRVLNIIQLIVPLILIIGATIGLTKLVINPEEKNGQKKVINSFIAAVVVFMIPTIVNAMLGIMPNSFSLKACWDQAKHKAEIARTSKARYINPYGDIKTTSILPKPEEYDDSERKTSSSGGSTWTGGTVTGEQIVAYAMQFKGMGYRLGCHWNGELPYQNASCIGFIVGLYKHFGIKVPCTEDTDMYLKDPSKFTVVTNGPHRPGDIVIFDGHYAMLTGNGNEIIHSTSTDGIIVSSNYLKSGQSVLGIVHVNVVQ